MRILALDCSTKASGVALFNNTALLGSSVITASSTDLIKRIHKMVDTIDSLI
jgi:tRNA A37 threonylcarbamoyladenosine modification protein TsaB